MNVRFVKYLLFILCSFWASTGYCSDDFSLFQPVFDPINAVQLEAERFNKSPNLILTETFENAFVALKADKYARVSSELEELVFSARIRGYENLPDFSQILLTRASEISRNGNYDKIRFLVNKAVELSPSDARILLSACTFYKDIGIAKSIEYFLFAMKALPKQPVFFSILLLNILLVLMVSLTVAFFLGSVIQMLTMSARIHKGLVSISPWSFRGLFAPIGLFALFVLPLYGGIIFAMCVWGIILACVKSSKKNFFARKLFSLSICILCVAWGVALPIISKVGYNVKSESINIFEDINRFGFSPRAERYINAAIEKDSTNILHLFSQGIIHKLKGKSDKAKDMFSKVMALSSPGTYINNTSKANLGVLEYENGDYQKAYEIFKSVELGGQSDFELYYNLTNVSTLVFDEKKHSLYFDKARSVDSERLELLVEDANVTPRALLYPAPKSLVYLMLLQPIAETNPVHSVAIEQSVQKAFNFLAYGLNGRGFILLGIFSAFLVFILPSFARKRSRDLKKSGQPKTTWSLFPGTSPLAGDRPAFGALVLSASLVFLFSGLGTPLSFYGNFTSSNSMAKEALLFSALIFILTTFTFAIFKKIMKGKKNE